MLHTFGSMSERNRIRVIHGIFLAIFVRIMPIVSSKNVRSVVLTSPSGSFTTPGYPSRYVPDLEHIWVIEARLGWYIELTFNVVDVEAYRGKCIDIVEVKDGSKRSSQILGGFCNANKPSRSFLSSGHSLRVWFQSAVNSDGGVGFNASYITLKDPDCGGRLQSFPGVISSPRYPTPYPNNIKCQWDIVATPGTYIYVEFRGIYHIELLCKYDICKCMDVLEITDGNLTLPYPPKIGYCLTEPRPFTSITNNVTMKFKTNDIGRYEGFNATYTTSLTPGCGGDLYFENGWIKSPNYPFSYHSLRKCIWRITVPAGQNVVLTFHTFDVEEAEDGCTDHRLEIRDGYVQDSPIIGTFCNSNPATVVKSTGNQLFILFQSGYNQLDGSKGFKIFYDVPRRRKPRYKELRRETRLSQRMSNGFNANHISCTLWRGLAFLVTFVAKELL